MTNVEILDSTLRDGSQGEGISYSVQDKIHIVQALDELGVKYIEAGNPGSNPKDMEFFQKAKELKLKNKNKLYERALEKKATEEQMKNENAIALMKREEEAAKKQAIADLQPVLDSIQTAEMARQKSIDDARIASMKAEAEIEKAKQEAYANTVKSIMESISEDLVAALTTSSNEAMLETVTKSMSPYAIANNESVSDVTNRLLRGTTLEGILNKIDTAADKIKCEVEEN